VDLRAIRERLRTSTLFSAFTMFVVWRLALFAFDEAGLHLITKVGTCRPQWEVFGPHHDFWNGFFRWDAAWYRNVALNGYYTYRPDQPSSVAFYPMFPHLARYLGPLFGSLYAAGLVVSNAATIGAIYYVKKLGALLFPDESSEGTSDRAATYILVFPTSFFLSAFYTEGLYFFWSAASMYFFLRERYVTSGVLGAFAMLTRSSGLVLFLALALDLGLRLGRKKTRFHWRMLGLFLIPAGLVVFMLILKSETGDPFAFMKTIRFWGREQVWPWTPVIAALKKFGPGLPDRTDDAQEVLDAFTAIVFFVIGLWMAKERMPVALWALVIGGVLLPLSTGTVSAMGRYTLVLFPAFLWLGKETRDRPSLDRFIVYGSAFFLAIYSLRFMRCAWAG